MSILFRAVGCAWLAQRPVRSLNLSIQQKNLAGEICLAREHEYRVVINTLSSDGRLKTEDRRAE